MSFSTKLINIVFSGRRKEIDNFGKNPEHIQKQQFNYLLENGKNTSFGKEHGFSKIKTPEAFRNSVPVSDYDTLKKYIAVSKEGVESVLWPGKIKWFAKSSGTTNDVSKFIPVTREGLMDCHLRGPKDIVATVVALFPDTRAYDGKTITLGGSHKLDSAGKTARSGDLSAILIENTPFWASWKRMPKASTALMSDFEKKVKQIANETIHQNITAFAGVPSWNLVMMNKILEYSGKKNLTELWPNLELFVHGGMSFDPYREQYQKIIPSDRMRYLETYNASEGFFAIQDDPSRNDMLLMLDYGIYYEFIPTEKLDDNSAIVPLEGVETGKNYAVIISSSNGLWRYMIGDTVEFTTTNPYRIRITGRTKLFINAFGEELIIDNAEKAIKYACEASLSKVREYTAAPLYMTSGGKGAHEWFIEFSELPADIELFITALDKKLQEINSDYAAKRYNNTTLMKPVVRIMPKDTFYNWMHNRGKLGGQNKVPRLANNRKYADELTEFIYNTGKNEEPDKKYNASWSCLSL
ncbi:MAG: GH3 auxin-responsive promoter family protein [Rikenellaceae bacterium]|nr:GH3 auxin-responsive promoter family protein [Rikenellaceae bacterium]